MAIWERYSQQTNLSTVATHTNFQIFTNSQTDELFESSDVVIVDGIVIVHCDTDDLCGFRLLILPPNVTSGEIDENDPAPFDPAVYYSWFYSRGPLVFRLRSKKTIFPGYSLWGQSWKEKGSNLTLLNSGEHLYFQVMH